MGPAKVSVTIEGELVKEIQAFPRKPDVEAAGTWKAIPQTVRCLDREFKGGWNSMKMERE
jgi:hypothetical protein